jgi:hypothetical protein
MNYSIQFKLARGLIATNMLKPWDNGVWEGKKGSRLGNPSLLDF